MLRLVARRGVTFAAHTKGIERVVSHPLFRNSISHTNKAIATSNAPPITVKDPASNTRLGEVADEGRAGAEKAVVEAHEAWGRWSRETGKRRGAVLRKWNDLLLENKVFLAELIVAEMGKPYSEALAEVHYAASFLEWFGEEAKRCDGTIIPSHVPHHKLLVYRESVGPVGCICPWNFPLAMITRKAGAALASGCTMVTKPSELTPFSAIALQLLGAEAGVPPGVFSVVTGLPTQIGEVLTMHPLIRKFTFTGSTAVGILLATQSSRSLKRVSLELGGNAPFIVFDSADIDAAVTGALLSKFRNSGQTCVCTNRILVQKGVYNEFVTKLKAKIAELKVGPGMEEGVTQGPLITASALNKVSAHVQDALHHGAVLELGGAPSSLGGTFYQPTLLTNVNRKMRPAREETFGPVAIVMTFEKESEAIEIANDTDAGLAAYFYSRDLGQCFRVADALQYGMVGVNEALIGTEVAPFGGVKYSGMGREGSKFGMDDYTNLKYVNVGGLDK